MPHEIYTVLHLFGIALLFTSLGGAIAVGAVGGDVSPERARALAKPFVIAHGVALLVILVAGFGLLAKKLGMGSPGSWGGWVYAKLVVWLALGGLLAVARRSATATTALLIGLPVLAAISAYLAVLKPF